MHLSPKIDWTRRLPRLRGLGFALLLMFCASPEVQAAIETEDDLIAALAEGGDVVFDADVEILLTRPLGITNSVSLDAAGNAVTINGDDLVQLFVVESAASEVTFNGLTLMNGTATNGGAMFINSGAIVTVTNCVFTGNKAVGTAGIKGADGPYSIGTGGDGRSGSSGAPAHGGAIYNEGELYLQACRFLTNSATGGNGGDAGDGGGGGFQGGNGGNGGSGAAGQGGAIFNQGTLAVSDCSFERNFTIGGDAGTGGAGGSAPFSGRPGIGGAGAASAGAAIYSAEDAVEASVTNCTFYANGVWGGNSAAGGMLDNGNGSDGKKGGNCAGGAFWSATANNLLQNCTFSQNVARGGDGGDGGPGRYTAGKGGNGGDAFGAAVCNSNALFILNCTFALNAAYGGTNGLAGSAPFQAADGSKGTAKGAGVANSKGTLSMRGSLLSTNAPGTNAANITGAFLDLGYNLSSDKSSVFTNGLSIKTNAVDLGPLADNGGTTKTMALLPTSLGRDRIPADLAPNEDQRGIPRPLNGLSDIGAFEVDTSGTPTITLGPVDQVLPQSSTTSFSVKVSYGTRPFYYQWFLNGAALGGATGATLTLANIQPAQAGLYTVQVRNTIGTNFAHASLYLAPFLVWGDGSYGLTNVPSTAGQVAAFAAGANHMLALRTNGTVVAWGAGQTNLNSEPNFGQAVIPAGLSNVVAVAAGDYHSLALKRDGKIIAWGNNSNGQTNVPAWLTNALAIAAGAYHSLAIKPDGTVAAWGRNTFGQTNALSWLSNVVQVAAGTNYSLALTTNGTVIAWGDNSLGQTNVPQNLTNVVAMAAGANHALALRLDGTVVAWGDNRYGQTNVPYYATNIVAVAAGANNSLALTGEGRIIAWGTNSHGQITIPPILKTVAIASGRFFTAALVNPASSPVEPQFVAPYIVSQPADAMSVQGGEVLLSVSAQGSGPLSYQWRHASTNLAGGTASRLSFKPLALLNAGAYDVVITNSAGSTTSRLASVRVLSANPVLSLTNVTGSALLIPSETGFTYTVETNTTLRSEEWQLFYITNGTGGTIALPTPNDLATNCFYRVSVQ